MNHTPARLNSSSLRYQLPTGGVSGYPSTPHSGAGDDMEENKGIERVDEEQRLAHVQIRWVPPKLGASKNPTRARRRYICHSLVTRDWQNVKTAQTISRVGRRYGALRRSVALLSAHQLERVMTYSRGRVCNAMSGIWPTTSGHGVSVARSHHRAKRAHMRCNLSLSAASLVGYTGADSHATLK